MKVLVTGANGQLGSELTRLLRDIGDDVWGCDKEDFDLTNDVSVLEAVQGYRPDAIIHCAAYTAVDKAETEPEVCSKVNAFGTLNMVRAALAVDAKLAYVSTDYVFGGQGDTPFEVNDPKKPLSVYGLSKLQGEEAVISQMTRYFVVRTSWVFGNGGNFVRTMRRLGAERASLNVVDDQIGSPTYAHDLAVLLSRMIHIQRYGVYHATNEGFCSWADFAQEIMAVSGLRCRVRPVSTEAYGKSLAKRPANSRLSKASLDAAGFARLPRWEDALRRYIAQEELRAAQV